MSKKYSWKKWDFHQSELLRIIDQWIFADEKRIFFLVLKLKNGGNKLVDDGHNFFRNLHVSSENHHNIIIIISISPMITTNTYSKYLSPMCGQFFWRKLLRWRKHYILRQRKTFSCKCVSWNVNTDNFL